MRKKITAKKRFETEPAGRRIDEILGDVLTKINQRMDAMSNRDCFVTYDDEKNNAYAPINVRIDDRHINIEMSCEYGTQQDGYLIEVEIKDSGEEVNNDTIDKTANKIEEIILDTVKIRNIS